MCLPNLPYMFHNTRTGRQVKGMWRLLKWLVYLALLAAIGVVAYAYIGPFFGADFSAPAEERREPVIIDVQ